MLRHQATFWPRPLSPSPDADRETSITANNQSDQSESATNGDQSELVIKDPITAGNRRTHPKLYFICRSPSPALSQMTPTYLELFRLLTARQKMSGDPLAPLPLALPKTADNQSRQWVWWTAAVMAAIFKEEKDVRLTLELEAQLRCTAAVSVLKAAAADGYDKQAKSAAGAFILRDDN